jgi:DNA-directed RNA polymerase subunit RPC12/RpoP
MTTLRLKVVQDPDSAKMNIVKMNSFGPFAKGVGPNNYLCGSCGKTLMKKVKPGEFYQTVIVCRRCGANNEA